MEKNAKHFTELKTICINLHSPPPSAEVKNVWSYTYTPQYVFMLWCLVKHTDSFTFTFTSNDKG